MADVDARDDACDQRGQGTGAYYAGAIEMPLFDDVIFADSFELLTALVADADD